MFERILIATADPARETSLRAWLEIVLGFDITIPAAVATVAELHKRLARFDPDLLIIDLSLPPDDKTPIDLSTVGGLDYVESEAQGRTVMIDARGPTSSDTRRRVARLGRVGLFRFDDYAPEEVTAELDALLEGLWSNHGGGQGSFLPDTANVKSEQAQVIVAEVVFNTRRTAKVEVFVTHSKVRPEVFPCAVTPEEFEDILTNSEMMDRLSQTGDFDEHWRKWAVRMGARLYSHIFSGEPQLRIDELYEEMKLNSEDLRIRFSMPPDIYAILFEALRKSEYHEFDAIDTPIARQVVLDPSERTQGRGIGLCEADVLNILVVDASQTEERIIDASDAPPFQEWQQMRKAPDEFPSLIHGRDEVAIFKALQDAISAGHGWQVEGEAEPVQVRARLGEVLILDPIGLKCETPQQFAKAIKTALRAPPERGGAWHILHFVGHSVAANATASTSGYLMLPGARRVAPIPVRDVLDELCMAGTRFVYFSSCQFGSSQVAVATAQKRVPATLGFRWSVQDDSACRFARAFYRALLSERLTIDEAVRDARRAMAKNPKHDIAVLTSAVFTCRGDSWHGERLKATDGGRA